MENKRIKDLLERYRQGTCTEEERERVERWYNTWEPEAFDLSDAQLISDLKMVKKRLPGQASFRAYAYRISAAAMLLLTLGVAYYFYQQPGQSPVIQQEQLTHHKIVPGRDQALLTLANGKTVVLDSLANGEILKEAGIKVSKSADGMLIYEVLDAPATDRLVYHTVTTPKGGQYQLLLPDGTRVWLNTASELKFPVAFTGKERRVELTGEAYFEVAKNPHKPFEVKTAYQDIQVLGTHFNVNAYADEELTKTTLLEGSVVVSSAGDKTRLRPGQQAQNSPASLQLKVNTVKDVAEAVAWKNGLFTFDNEDIYTIMNKIARWYDVEVVFTRNMRGKTYGGSISRFENVTEVLKTMELTGTIHFKIEGRRILVMP